jgi:hypothetical protein
MGVMGLMRRRAIIRADLILRLVRHAKPIAMPIDARRDTSVADSRVGSLAPSSACPLTPAVGNVILT